VPEERDELIERIAAELRQVPPLDRALDARVMAEIAALPPYRSGGLSTAVRWLQRPITLQVSPLAGLAAAAGIALLLWMGLVRSPDEPQMAATTTAAAPGVLLARHGQSTVQFVLVAPDARSVVLVGDFNDWDLTATPLRQGAGGTWPASLRLPPGRHRYAFVVDGSRWIADPTAPPAPDDDFGTPGSVVTVGA
jgi:hypothetical protein